MQRKAGANSAITPRHTMWFIGTPCSSTTVGVVTTAEGVVDQSGR